MQVVLRGDRVLVAHEGEAAEQALPRALTGSGRCSPLASALACIRGTGRPLRRLRSCSASNKAAGGEKVRSRSSKLTGHRTEQCTL